VDAEVPTQIFYMIRATPADVTGMPLIGGVFSCHIRLAGPLAAVTVLRLE
jgi:hypothetical protein